MGVADFASRYLLDCEALATTQEAYAFTVFQRVFHEFGLPTAIRTDNGVPFASAQALFGLSKLAVGWLRLGIAFERIKPGHRVARQQQRAELLIHITDRAIEISICPVGWNLTSRQILTGRLSKKLTSRESAQSTLMPSY